MQKAGFQCEGCTLFVCSVVLLQGSQEIFSAKKVKIVFFVPGTFRHFHAHDPSAPQEIIASKKFNKDSLVRSVVGYLLYVKLPNSKVHVGRNCVAFYHIYVRSCQSMCISFKREEVAKTGITAWALSRN